MLLYIVIWFVQCALLTPFLPFCTLYKENIHEFFLLTHNTWNEILPDYGGKENYRFMFHHTLDSCLEHVETWVLNEKEVGNIFTKGGDTTRLKLQFPLPYSVVLHTKWSPAFFTCVNCSQQHVHQCSMP